MDLQRLKDFFIEEALPKWAVAAYDERYGHFMESLKLDGTPETTGIVRTRTAARLIYVYAHATVLGVAPAGSLQKQSAPLPTCIALPGTPARGPAMRAPSTGSPTPSPIRSGISTTMPACFWRLPGC